MASRNEAGRDAFVVRLPGNSSCDKIRGNSPERFYNPINIVTFVGAKMYKLRIDGT